MTRFACLRLPRWPIQRHYFEQPALRRSPLLLHRRDSRRGECVVDCCQQTECCGVHGGMPLAEALAMLGPAERRAAVILPCNEAADVNALGRLATRCQRFSPIVGWETLASRANGLTWHAPPSHLFLDINGVSHLFGGEYAYARTIVADFAQRGLHVRVGFADTIGAAWALTTADGSPVIAPPGERVPLWPLSVQALRLTPEILDALARLGVATIEQLMLLPRDGLAERFGPLIGLRLDQLFGVASETILPHRPPPRYEASVRLESPTDRRETLDGLLDELIARVAGELRKRNLGAMRLAGQLRCESESMPFGIGLFQPSHDAAQWRSLLRLQFERLALPSPVEHMWLRADPVASMEWRRPELFPGSGAVDEPALAALANRLSSRLGNHAVVRPMKQAGALPEAAYRYVPLVESRRRRAQSDQCVRLAPRDERPLAEREDYSPERLSTAAYRPMRLFAPPIRIDGPAVFRWQGRQYVPSRWWGPERIETNWWRQPVRRDYYRVETETGNHFWLFRDLRDGVWHLHGSFE